MESIGETSPNGETLPFNAWYALEPNIQEDLLDALAGDLEIAASEETIGAFQKAGLAPHTHGWRECFRDLFDI